MLTKISCPQCSQPVDPQARHCDHCGVDLALAAVVAERSMNPLPEIPAGIPLAPEILVPRMGEFLLERGKIRSQDLQRALDYQNQQAASGKPILLGQAFLELGMIDREELDEIVTTQILQLQDALSQVNRQLEQRVTERTQDLKNALDRLAELNQLKSNFIANISHELRTPLTHIKGYLDLLVSEGLGPLQPAQLEAIGVMQRSEERLESLIEDLIQFSLASRGELSLNLDVVDLRELITSVLNRSGSKSQDNKIQVIQELPDQISPVKVDREKISWVMLQLLDNAFKFTPPGGIVQVKAVEDKGLILVSVQDNGIGIPQERLCEIFEPFHQLDGSATRHYGGTGMGLSMAKRILEAHGSDLKVRSDEGKGSSFEFALAAVKNPDHRKNGK